MDLTSVREVVDSRRDLPWARGDVWLAGGTFLFAEPQPGLVRLRDLTAMGWQPLTVTEQGLSVAATCTIAELLAFAEDGPGAWPRARETIAQCCRAFSSSPKVWSTATVGGNICLALPAAPMISLAVAFDGVLELRSLDGDGRVVPAAEFVTGAGRTVLRPGEVLRSLVLPSSVLGLRSGMRRAALRPQGRSAAVVTGIHDPVTQRLTIGITAAVSRPFTVSFPSVPSADRMRRSVLDALPMHLIVDDVHGLPAWRRHLAVHLAEEVRQHLMAQE
ncbi:FAD binding domain-containing protein [Streptomyces sp. ISL-22]|uniref:FAD binding domain-containing protein n=1 Tax=unclassified Streptomyces TaxID=2593676 RepID=UPI001BE5B5BC|nr:MULTISPECIES: FAD binding domain-containing protein [unclassified Streptomyces]MBT2420354.1 FAD binding domain-containing protein [Streptomyces sp. ISL-24]MBT2433032.1 FAD binding domain-containing protein [Streptomyces sp. ISL-22]